MIVNPSKKKFEDTVLNETHYDLLRIYNNRISTLVVNIFTCFESREDSLCKINALMVL
jgi:hypothetical protein